MDCATVADGKLDECFELLGKQIEMCGKLSIVRTDPFTANSDVRYDYDALNRLQTVSVVKRDGVAVNPPEVTTNDYTALGSLQDVFYPNGIHAAWQYDVMNRLTNLTYQAGTTNLATYSYKADAAGRRTNAVEILRQENGLYLTNMLTWQYDGLNRLTNEVLVCSVASASYTNSYWYDLAGNRLAKIHTGSSPETITYQYNSNDVLTNETSSVNPTAIYLYDANGSLTNKTVGTTVNSYTYNLENKLSAMAVNGVTNAVYQYDSQGLRISSNIGGNKTNYLIDANNLTGYSQVLEELPTVGGTPSRSYVMGNDALAQSASGTLSYFLKDGHGNNRQLASANGTVSSHYSYDAYGAVQASLSSTTAEAALTTKLFCGEQYDSVLQMYNLRARYYIPGNGRLNQPDALDGVYSDPQSLHKYAYCKDDPINRIDPSGNEDLASLSLSMSIATTLEIANILHVYAQGSGLITEGAIGNETIAQIADQQPNYQNDTATIVVHGVMPHSPHWSDGFIKSLRDEKTGDTSQTGHNLRNPQLQQDFYVFTWSGFALPGISVPVKSVHELAYIQLQQASLLIWMNGYDKINVISHSWGTTLSYDLLNSSGMEFHDWVTMGSPLKPSMDKPVWDTGEWLNYYSLADPVVHYEMYPPFPSFGEMAKSVAKQAAGFGGPGLTGRTDIIQRHFEMGHWGLSEHTAYWDDGKVLDNLRLQLQH